MTLTDLNPGVALLKKYGLKLLPYVIVLVVGVGVGWKLHPSKVEVHEVTKTITSDKEILKAIEDLRTEINKSMDSQKETKLHVETTTTKTPDGGIVIKRVEDKNVDTVVHEKETQTQVQVVTVEKQVVVTQEKLVEKTVTSVLPQWHVGALIGTQNPLMLDLKVLNTGLEVERRVFGPFWLGVYGNVNPTNLKNYSFGLKLGLELP